jgi:cytoskeletal protein CcmA (bactofilin family)
MSDEIRLTLLSGGITLIAVAIVAGALLFYQWRRQRSHIEISAMMREPTTTAEMGSCIGRGMTIVGSIECNGPAQVFGEIDGELRATDLVIGDGAHVAGIIIAEDVTVCGRVKGTIRAVRVKLQNGGAVEGDIFHRSLAMDQNCLFEGTSRRVENPTETLSSSAIVGAQKDMPSQTTAPVRNIDVDLQHMDETTVGAKH